MNAFKNCPACEGAGQTLVSTREDMSYGSGSQRNLDGSTHSRTGQPGSRTTVTAQPCASCGGVGVIDQ